MPVVKVGQSGKANSTVAASIHEADDVPIITMPGPVIVGQAPKNKLQPSRSGFVTQVPLAYDIYGVGPVKILFLTGLASSRNVFVNQIEYFARKAEYSCLVIENRGYDNYEPSIPLKSNSTKQMAKDVKVALEALEWTDVKGIHVLGFSLGGMVALQLAHSCPDYIGSLHLVATAAVFRDSDWETVNAVKAFKLLKDKNDTDKLDHLLDLLFTPEYLYAFDSAWPEYKSNKARFLDNRYNFINKNQRRLGLYSQILAFRNHKMKSTHLWEIAAKIRYIYVSAADQDALLSQKCADKLMNGLNAQGRLYHGGHGILWQYKHELNADQEAMIQRAEREYLAYPPPERFSIQK